MFGDQVRKSGKDIASLTRLKARLEVVTESVGEASGEWTERAALARMSGPRKSSFIVEKIDYHPTDDDVSSRERSGSGSRPAAQRRLLNSPPPQFPKQKPPLADPLFASFATPQKRDVFVVDGAFASPRERSEGGVGAKSGFFSVRKKTAPTVSKHIKLRIDAADGDRELRIELPSEAGLGPWVVSSGAKEVRDTATTAAGGPTPTNSGGKIRIVNNIFQNTILQGVGKSQPSGLLSETDPLVQGPPHLQQAATHRPKSRVKPDTAGPTIKSSGKRKMNLSVDHRDCKPTANEYKHHHQQQSYHQQQPQHKTQPTVVTTGFVSPKHKGDAKLFSFSGRPVSAIDESLHKTNGSRNKEHETSTCFSRRSGHSGAAVVLSAAEATQFEKMKKFHSRLTKLMRDTGVDEGAGQEEVGLGEAWRFVKKVVVGYVDAKTQLKLLQGGGGQGRK